MRRMERTDLVPLLLVVLLAAAPLAAAEETEGTKDAKDEVEGEVVFGPQYFVDSDNRDSGKFEEYRDVPNGFVIDWFDFLWRPSERSYFGVSVTDVSQRDQRLRAEFGRQDVWRGTVRWSENPREWTDHAFQLFARTGPGVFTLEDSFQAAVRAAPASVDADADIEWDAGTKGFIIKNAISQGAHEVE